MTKNKKKIHKKEDTIAAVSTPIGKGGLGIVRVSGGKALGIADKIFVSKEKIKPSRFKTHTVHYGFIRNPGPGAWSPPKRTSLEPRGANPEVIDEVLLTVMRAPRTYTREDVVEISSHGGTVTLRKVLESALLAGARLADPGEFTKRAFINGRIDLSQAEAVLDIIESKTQSSLKAALGQLEGALSREIKLLKEGLADARTQIEADINFSEEDITTEASAKIIKNLKNICGKIEYFIEESEKGMIMKEGALAVICGKPNVGKSSLMNVMLKRNRVIVTPVPGTTRDAIEEEVNLRGVPLRLVDTAGIAKTRNIVEKHALARSRSYLKKADIILLLLDASRKWSKEDEALFKKLKGKKYIAVLNKTDLKRKLYGEYVKKRTKNAPIEVSLLKKNNLEALENAILKKIWKGDIAEPETSFVSNIRHKKALLDALGKIRRAIRIMSMREAPLEVASEEINSAIYALGSILGDAVELDVLERIFSKFCVGK